MRRKGTSEELAVVRNRGLALLEKGKKPKEVTEILKVIPRCVNRWRQESKKPKRKKTTRSVGRPRKLDEKQIKKLEKALGQGAYIFGYTGIIGRSIGLHKSSGNCLRYAAIRVEFGISWIGWAGAISAHSVFLCTETPKRLLNGRKK